jgi:hypothetical protein
MSTDTDNRIQFETDLLPTELPTRPCSVVWSHGHPFVLERLWGQPRWVGVDDRGRTQTLTDADLRRRGWSLRDSRG